MALNPSVLKTRSLSAAVFVLVMLTGLFWNEWSFLILFSLIHFGAWYEYQKLISQIDPQYGTINVFHRYGVMLGGWCLMWFFTNENYRIGHLSLHTIGWWAGMLLLIVVPLIEIIILRTINVKNILYSAMGLAYISLSIGLLTNMRTIEPFWGKLIVLVIIGSIWINDTMAYIVGSLIGRRPFSSISPKKTWEGTIGGVILSIVVMGTIGYFFSRYTNQNSQELNGSWVLFFSIIAVIASITGTAGDLLESKLKRMAGVKDSGQIMPGHGGFLDRFDSLLIATPFVWLYIMWVIS